MTLEEHVASTVFPIGEPNDGFDQYFSGNSFLASLSKEQVNIFNVTFEPGCRNNWHVHRSKSAGGQILICVAGQGYYQEWGKDAVKMVPGGVVNIPANVKHWHGAAPASWFSHLAVEVPGEQSSNEWLEAVTDSQYAAAAHEQAPNHLPQGENGLKAWETNEWRPMVHCRHGRAKRTYHLRRRP